MVYESDFYTTRRYRPSVSSYTVSYPYYTYRYIPSRVYSYSYPIYSYIPYVAHKRLYYGTRVLSSPVRVTTSPIRTVRTHRYLRSSLSPSPVRTVITTRSITPAPEITTSYRVITSPIRDTPYYTSYPLINFRTPRSVFLRELDRIYHKYRPKYGYRPLEDYLNSEPFLNFDSEARNIRANAASLLRDIHSPVPRARSSTPFPVTRYSYCETPSPNYALDAYVSRVTNPLHNIANDVKHLLLNTPVEPRKYTTGKSYLASTRIVGNKAYHIRNPLYDPDRIKIGVEFLSHYLQNRGADMAKDPELVKFSSVDAEEAKEVPASG